MSLSLTFNRFVQSEKAGGLVLLACTVIAMAIANSPWGPAYLGFWHVDVGGLSLEHWVNDALMAIFFLLIGLELERELYVGELSQPRQALLPVLAALGGMSFPALIHFAFNQGTPTQAGIGIPMATDIAFALGVLAILGKRIPNSLKVFVVALAVIDDLGAIVIIAIAYTSKLALGYLIGALVLWMLLLALNRMFRVMTLLPYLIGGVVLWVLMLKSGIHATLAGVLLAFAIPFSHRDDDAQSPSHRLEHALHKPVAFMILPLFALANGGIIVNADWISQMSTQNSIGIALGLLVGKPLGVVTLCLLGVLSRLCRLPPDLTWKHVIGAGMLAGIGFTMAIFISNLAFPTDAQTVNDSKLAILVASLLSGALGLLWLICGSAAKPAEPAPSSES
jgi:NhaA family Na+:H+ antiporter